MRRRARAGQFGLAMACGASLAACSLFVSTDGLEGGGDDGGASFEASTNDVANDASLTDAAKDATPLGDGRAPGFCEQHPGHKICWDFDESTAVPATDETSYDPMQLFVDPADSVSKPTSLALKWAAGSGNSSITDNIMFTKAIAVTMDIRMTSADLTTGQLVPIYIVVPPTADQAQHSFYLQSYYGDFDVAEGVMPADGGEASYDTWSLATPVPADTWVHVEFSVDGETGLVKISYNGAALADVQALSGFPPGDGRMSLGAYTVNIPAAITERVDNFTFDY